MFQNLSEADKEIHNLIVEEEKRQREGIELIASENFASVAVLEANGSIFTNKYSEGYPGQRYYGGNLVIDKLESLCQKRALKLFNLDENIWGVNVQALSGSPANFAVYTALIGPGGRIMGLDLPCGGHLTHGYQSKTRKVSATSLFFESFPYKTGADDLIDYEETMKRALNFKPQVIICGYSAYPRDIHYKKFREIADSTNAFLMADISHINGLVACGLMNNPFEFADIVTTTTHKIMRGPRGALIFYKKTKTINDQLINIEQKINMAVFPGLQGGPHNQTICAIAVALKFAASDEYKKYINLVSSNAKILASSLIEKGFNVVTGGTDSHLVLVDLRNFEIDGAMVERVCEISNITINKNCIPSSSSPLNPEGIRLGVCAMTTRGLQNEHFVKIAEFIYKAVLIGKEIQKSIVGIDLKNQFEEFNNLAQTNKALSDLRREVIMFSKEFPLPILKIQK